MLWLSNCFLLIIIVFIYSIELEELASRTMSQFGYFTDRILIYNKFQLILLQAGSHNLLLSSCLRSFSFGMRRARLLQKQAISTCSLYDPHTFGSIRPVVILLLAIRTHLFSRLRSLLSNVPDLHAAAECKALQH